MSYTNGEALILTRVRAATSFDANNTTRNDWDVLNTGKSDRYAVVKKLEDNAPVDWNTICEYVIFWTTVVEVWQMNENDDDQAAADCQGLVNEIIAQIQVKPRLGDTTDTIQQSTIVGIGGPVNAWLSDGGPVWAKMEVHIEWQEAVTVTFT